MTTQTQPQARRGKRFSDLVNDVKPSIREISKSQLQQWLEHAQTPDGEPFILLDVREPDEVAGGQITHVSGEKPVTIPRGHLELYIDEAIVDQDAVIVCYCRGGNRSALAADTLQKMGYSRVYSLAGGWRQWTAA
ncbi:MAG: rhodanese-like domain-containing protein [Vampirovibrionales bacterium]|nr:rhodanese-like domain-containing protein [Vampirovibrionales bacterium]